MSEFRQDPLSRRWVIVGCDDRAARPNEFVEATTRQSDLPCPFCAGNEGHTPDAVATYAANGTSDWSVRVVPNKYPAVTLETPPCPSCQPLAGGPTSGSAAGFGAHEVIIESPRHVASLSELTDAEIELVFRAYRDRIRDLAATGRFQYVQIFKNVGPAAGASLEHVHSQLVALPGVPEVLQQELIACSDYYREHNRPLLTSLIDRELAAGDRIVAQTPNFVAFCPYASRFPYETWLAPRRHQPRFEAATEAELVEIALLARDIVGRIERAAGIAAYNAFLHTLPFNLPSGDHYHWHIEILPRLTKVAGFEWSTGCFINPFLPESAAALLRRAKSQAAALGVASPPSATC
jgi:UDPglucose--hexose-1-phosphate uridylyltransferase